MSSKTLNSFACLLGLLVSCVSWAADSPTVHDVYLAAESGKLSQAQNMIEQVIAEHPKSSKAHYVAAEIYAKEGKLSLAKNELKTAEQLEPGLPYAKAQAVEKLEQSIGAPNSTPISYPQAQHAQTSFSWGLLLLLIGVIAVIGFIARAISARNSPQVISGGNYPSAGVGMQQPHPNNPYPYAPAQQSSGLGSGILGGLATGAALGAGMVAGEALMHHFTDGGHAEANTSVPPQQDAWASTSNDMGGQDFGIADNSSWDDSSDMADIGGNDWS